MNGRARVLVVDDEPGVALVLTELLLGEGYEVRHTANGHDALQLIGEWLPDVVVLDLTLPGIDGLEVARRVRDRPDERAQVPVVVITGAHGGLGAAADIGAVAAIQKPFTLERVVDAVDKAVRGRTSA
jgi:two-component system, response regulator, stage 0 sporulation protein F